MIRLFFYHIYSKLLELLRSYKAIEPHLSKNDISNSQYLLEKHYVDTLFVYAATIGELQAVTNFIRLYGDLFPESDLFIVTGHEQYIDAYKKLYPDATILNYPKTHYSLMCRLFKHISPKLVMFAEGPALLRHFPICHDVLFPALCLKHHIPLTVLNACLYDIDFSSKGEYLEYKLFRKIHTDAVSYWFTNTEGNKKELENADAIQDKVIVVGDMKFDNVFANSVAIDSHKKKSIVDMFGNIQPIIVAGSVNDINEQVAIINAWIDVCKEYPEAVLVIAPRYINNIEVMNTLYSTLERMNISYQKRSETFKSIQGGSVLIIDTFGELQYFYSIASLCYIGRNHGVLEPMKFHKPTVVGPENKWRKNYSAYPLYHMMSISGGIIRVEDEAETGKVFLKLLNNKPYADSIINKAKQVIKQQQGAANKTIEYLKKENIL